MNGMNPFYSDKNICLRLRVSYENQERLKAHCHTSHLPLFSLKRDQFFNIRFEYKTFTCTYKEKKQTFSYSDVNKIETVADGLIIYLSDNRYISIAPENFEKHNSELYDIVTFLRKYNRKKFCELEEIVYPDEITERYKSEKEPIDKIAFELSDRDIARLWWYDYLIDERMLTLIIPVLIGFSVAILLQNPWLAILSTIVTVLIVIMSITILKYKDSFTQNHKGKLYALLYDDILVIRLRNTDLELEYHSMKRLKNLFGFWRMKSGNFFVLTLPKRIVEENTSFFDKLYKKIK